MKNYTSKFLPKKYKIGKWTYGIPKIKEWGVNGNLEIGNYCSIAKDVIITLGGEHANWVSTYPFMQSWKADVDNILRTKGSVKIGNDVWIGMNVLILSGVKIGDGAIIGAGSVVTKDIEPYSIVGGNPAREIKKRFDSKIIEKLLEIKWWNWKEEKIKEFLPYMYDTDTFLAEVEKWRILHNKDGAKQ